MRYRNLLKIIGEQGWFEFATLVQLADEPRNSLRVQLHRWCQTGDLLPLRRGMYALPERYRKRPLNPTDLANHLYMPSYLSMHWALGYYGMIPERVIQHTSITRRKPAKFENDFGVFVYRNIKSEAFFGYQAAEIGGVRVQIAEPEKALLDLWHLEKGKWDLARMDEMRFQGFEMVDSQRLKDYAKRFRSARLDVAVRTWLKMREQESEGVEL